METQEKILINEEASVALLVGKGAVVNLFPSKVKAQVDSVNRPDQPLIVNTSENALGLVARWGDDNLFPQNVLDAIRKNTIIPSTLDWKARALYAGGISYGTLSADGKDTFTPGKVKEIDEFIKKSNINANYLVPGTKDFYHFYNLFPELTLSKDRSKIVQLSTQKAVNTRYSIQNQETGLIDTAFINANWRHFASASDPRTITRPVLDLYYDPVNALKERTDSFNYIYPLSNPTPGETYYALADWYSVVASGWLDAANAIAQFKKYLMQNQITVKYLIKVPEYWWKWKYKNWDNLNDTQRKAIIDTELTAFNDFLTGAANAGKSIMTTFKFDAVANREYPGWAIEAIDDKLKSGIYVEDSQEASSHMLYALGVDATLIGTVPGKGIGTGSGSDKREAFNMYMSLCQMHEDIILAPLNFIRDYNGWPEDIVFRFKRPILQTLDKVTPAQRNTAPGGATN
jgi:hypothetical protein